MTDSQEDCISGIQQIGIGVADAGAALLTYKMLFGMDTMVFDDISDARLMARYTGGQVHRRRAALSLNLQGGGGFEVWQFQDRQPAQPSQAVYYGDLGIYAAKVKSANVRAAYSFFRRQPGVQVTGWAPDEQGRDQFWLRDPYGNIFQVMAGQDWFGKPSHAAGGVAGAVIGVSDMDRSLEFYRLLLNSNAVCYDQVVLLQSPFEKQPQRYRKVLLEKHSNGKGAFGKLLGGVSIELVQCLDRVPAKIFGQRLWGDCGFIHICFDVFDMDRLQSNLAGSGYAFTVDSLDSFRMAQATGRFCYVEDPDGTLIELVETHKVPVVKKLGLYFDLKKRDLQKPLPPWMIRLLSLSKVK